MALSESGTAGVYYGTTEASNEIEALERVEYALTSNGFLPIGESRFSGFSWENFLPDVVERNGLEIYAFKHDTESISSTGFNLVAALPLAGPVEGFTPQEDYGRKVWTSVLRMSEGESAESMIEKLNTLIEAFERARLKEPEVQPHAFIDIYAAEAQLAKMRNEVRRRFMNPICLGVLLGFLAGSNIGEALHESRNESRPGSEQKSSSADQEILDPQLEYAQNGMIIGGLLGFVVGSARVRRYRKNKKNL